MSDLGGANGLFNILKEFYNNLITKIPGMRARKAVRKLCERELVTDSGLRNSVNKEEIMEKFNLSEEILNLLVRERLLREDQKADRTFYELAMTV